MHRFCWIALGFIVVFIDVFAQWEGDLPCECADYERTKIIAPPFTLSITSHPSKRLQEAYKDVYGSRSEIQTFGDVSMRNFTIYTKNNISFKTAKPCFRIDFAPCREVDYVYAELSGNIVYRNLIDSKYLRSGMHKYIDIKTKSCALRCDSTFLSQLNEFFMPIDDGYLTCAAFLVKTPQVRMYNARKYFVYNQKKHCGGNYLFTQNNVVLQVEDYKLDLHKHKNLAEIIYLYENCNSSNPARHKSLVSKRKIKKFVGVFAPEATVFLPIQNNKVRVHASEILVGNYFFSAVLAITAKQVDNKTFVVSLFPNQKEQLTIKEIQKNYFDTLNLVTGNFHYDSEKQLLLVDVYYEQKK